MKINVPLISANFVQRPNRFITIIDIDGVKHLSHLPDPGRLKELLLPGVELLVRKENKGKNSKNRIYYCYGKEKWSMDISCFNFSKSIC